MNFSCTAAQNLLYGNARHTWVKNRFLNPFTDTV